MLLRSICLSLLAAWPLSSACAQSPLSSVPSDASVVVRFASVETLESSVTAFAEELEEGAGLNAAAALHEMLGEVVQDPDLEGVDTTSDWYLAVFADGTGEPGVVVMIPANDGDAILENIDEDGVVRDGYVLVSPNGGDVESLLGASEADSILKEIPDLEGFNGSDVAVFVNVDELVSTYSDEIEMAWTQVNATLDQLEQLQGQIPNAQVDIGAVVDMYRSMLDWADDTLADAEAVMLTLNVNDAEIVVDSRLVYRAGSESADGLKAGGAEVVDAFASLPEGMPVYFAASGASLSEMMEWGMSFSLSMLGGDEAEQLEELVEGMSELGFGVMSGCASLPSDGQTVRGVTQVELDDVEGYRQLIRDFNEAIGDVDLGVLQQTTTVEEDAETYGDYTADVVTVTQEFQGPGSAEQQRMNDYMFGEDGMVTRMVFDDEAVLSTIGGGPELMEAAIEAYDSGEQDLSAWTEGAIEDPTLVVLLDLPVLVRQMIHMVSEAGPPSPIPPQIITAVDEMELETSYITLSTGSEENSSLGRISVPAAQVQPIMMFFYLAAPAQLQ